MARFVRAVGGGGKAKLAKVVEADGASRGFLSPAQGGQEKPRQNGDDRDDNQQLDECKGAWPASPARARSIRQTAITRDHSSPFSPGAQGCQGSTTLCASGRLHLARNCVHLLLKLTCEPSQETKSTRAGPEQLARLLPNRSRQAAVNAARSSLIAPVFSRK